ncbi:uncharacterized protein V1518DRAFT_294996 [Limtongia smithiae]|uniref:uncharacterized protein n=1 Tax=Limtongia smithiae TaxID=1125753 RepID=UPI0034CDEDD5
MRWTAMVGARTDGRRRRGGRRRCFWWGFFLPAPFHGALGSAQPFRASTRRPPPSSLALLTARRHRAQHLLARQRAHVSSRMSWRAGPCAEPAPARHARAVCLLPPRAASSDSRVLSGAPLEPARRRGPVYLIVGPRASCLSCRGCVAQAQRRGRPSSPAPVVGAQCVRLHSAWATSPDVQPQHVRRCRCPGSDLKIPASDTSGLFDIAAKSRFLSQRRGGADSRAADARWRARVLYRRPQTAAACRTLGCATCLSPREASHPANHRRRLIKSAAASRTSTCRCGRNS